MTIVSFWFLFQLMAETIPDDVERDELMELQEMPPDVGQLQEFR